MSTRTNRRAPAAKLQRVELPKPALTEPNALPDWATKTPECSYTLEMFCGNIMESVDLTRAEYIRLKCALAESRGFKVPDSAWKEEDATTSAA